MPKEDKERFIEVITELDEKNRTFTDEEIIQLTEWKFEAERLAAKEQGIEQGLNEGQNKIVANMLKENYKIEEIIKITGLTEEEIIKIKETL